MITFGYLAGYARNEKYMGAVRRSPNLTGFINQISDELSFCGIEAQKSGSNLLADFDAILYVVGYPLDSLPALIKEFRSPQTYLPPKETLQTWNELIFNLYEERFIPNDSIIGSGLHRPEQRLYGGHFLIAEGKEIELSVSLTSIDVLFELTGDIFLGLQSLMAIISNLEGVNLIGDINEWRLTFRPGMLYEEIYNGRDS